ncbi:MAG: sensor histidine kinase [Firmicutes bacterium]|nr:sensor histidine kinase [Bacillota bacterium]
MNKKVWMLFVMFVMLGTFSTIATAATSDQIEFTSEEKAFIKEHPTIHLGVDPEFVPYEFIDSDGVYKGIAADYIKLLSQRIGIEFQIEKDITWSDAYEMGVEKKLDALPCVSKTTERQNYFLFSEPYFTFQRVIIVREDNNAINNLEDLKYTTVSVQENSSHHSYLSKIPEINLSLYPTVEEALIAVSKGNETSFVGNLATSAYLIKSYGLTGLKYVSLDEEDQQHLYFAVRNDWPVLVSIINKGLVSITEEEKMEITDKWIGLENRVDYSRIIRYLTILGIFILAIFMVSVYWILRLKKEIAKRSIIEEELRCSKSEAEMANRVKSTFLARMSHEIRTPLNAIIGMSYLIRKTDISLTQRMYVDKINQAAHNMLGIINDILDFSKIEAGKIEIEKISFSLDKVIQQVISVMSFRVEEQKIDFSFAKDSNIPTFFIGDSKRIEQMLLNLLSNAVKFTSEGEVSLGIRLLTQEGNQYELEFSVKDTGIGMSETQIQQLFLPFSQADSSINRRFGGTGLGLSIVKSLVEMMDGEIQIHSKEGQGSTFIIKLPLPLDEEREFAERNKAASIYVQDLKILVLAQNDTLIHLMDTYMTSFGMKAEFIKSPENAGELLEESHRLRGNLYNLFIIDYDVLEDKCFEYARHVLETSSCSVAPKVIMLLPLIREDLFEKLSEYGIHLGITKPIIPSILFDGIQELFKKDDLEGVLPSTISEKREKKVGANCCVLVVEDNKTNQLIAKTILEQVGLRVILTENGEEGSNYYLQNRKEIDLILMDLHMPVLNGYEAAVRIRLQDTEVPIVAMTADAITGVEDQCRSVGINHYISKPFDPDKFIDTVLDLLEQHSSIDTKSIIEIPTVDEKVSPQAEKLINQDAALKLLGNNIPIYQMVLKEYQSENISTCDEIDQEIRNKNYIHAAEMVHKVKGSTGNIGAGSLYQTAVRLQKALEQNQEESIVELVPLFKQQLRQCLLEITDILDDEKDTCNNQTEIKTGAAKDEG